MVHLAERLPFEVPRPCAALDGSEIVAVERDGATYLLRLVTFIEGEPLIDAQHLAPPVLFALGGVAGSVARALENFEHAAADRAMQWDPRHVGAVVEALAPHVEDAARRELVARGRGRRAARRSSGSRRDCRSQIVHCDVTDWNVDRPARPRRPADAVRRDRLRRRHAHAARLRARRRGLDRVRPRAGRRRSARPPRSCAASTPPARSTTPSSRRFPHLIAARAAILAVGTEQQAVLEPHNAYAQRVRAGDWAICETAAAQPAALVDAAFRLACRPQRRRARAARPVRGLAASRHRAGGARRPLADGARLRARAARRDRRPRRGAPARDARALERRARDRPPRPRPLRRRAAPRCARRSRAASSGPAGASSCSRQAASRCAWPASRPPWRPARPLRRATCSGSIATRAAALPPHLHVQVAPTGLAELPGLATAGARAGLARALPAPRRRCSGSPAGRAAPASAARPPPRRDPAGAAALLRGAAGDRARPAPAPLRRARPRLPRLRQQRRRARPQPSARDRRPRPASCGCSTRTRASSTRA